MGNKLFEIKKELRVHHFMADFIITCLCCGKEYIPAEAKPSYHKQGVSVLLANNWCSRKCFELDGTNYREELDKVTSNYGK
jgi:hypothetical protein